MKCICGKHYEKEQGLRAHWGRYHNHLLPTLLESIIRRHHTRNRHHTDENRRSTNTAVVSPQHRHR